MNVSTTWCSNSSSTSLPWIASSGRPRAGLVDQLAQPLGGGERRDLLADRLGQRAVQGDLVPVAREVARAAVGQGHLQRAERRERRLLDQLAGEYGDRVVVAVGLVGLEHRELGAVRGVRALVAEVAVDLEDLLEATDDAPLEEQLGCDPQEHVEVERVDVRDERPRGRAAVQGLQHRRLDLDEAALVERPRSDCTTAGRSRAMVPRVRSHDQVDVALPDPRLLRELSALVEVGQRAQRLGGDGPRVREDRQLAAARRRSPRR